MSILKECIIFDNRILIPEALRGIVLQRFHEDHPGIVAMKSSVRSLIWYPDINDDIERLVKSCTICQNNRFKPSQKCHVEWPQPQRPWQRIHIDHFSYNNHSFLLVIDSFSKYIEYKIVKNTGVQETIFMLRMIFIRQGLCETLISDNASCFTAYEFKNFMIANGIKHITPPPYSPSSNGLAEVGVRIIKNLLKKCNNKMPLKCNLAKILLFYRSTPHSVTKVPPCISLNNRKYITLKYKINPFYISSEIKNSQNKRVKQFEVGDSVLALNPTTGPKWVRGVIIDKLGINIYKVFVKSLGLVWKRHLSQLLVIPPNYNERLDSLDGIEDNVFITPQQGSNNENNVLGDNEDEDIFHDAFS